MTISDGFSANISDFLKFLYRKKEEEFYSNSPSYFLKK